MVAKRTAIKGQANTAAPWEPAEVSPAEILAIQAMTRGDATHDQQLRFVAWLEKATAVGEMSYRQSERDTAFAEGKRFVGLQFFTLAKTYLATPAAPRKDTRHV